LNRASILFIAGCAVAFTMLYGLFYWFGPEAALANPDSMRKYKLSKLSEGEINSITVQAKQEAAAGGKVTDALGQVTDLMSEQERFDWHVMGSCLMTRLTIREARRIGCLPPK